METVFINDAELLAMISSGENSALLIMSKRYRRYSMNYAIDFLSNYRGSGITPDELENVGLEVYYRCLDNFINNNGNFYAFWRTYVTKAYLSYVHENAYFCKAKPFMGSFSLDEELPEGHFLSDIVTDENDQVLNEINKNNFMENYNKALKTILKEDERNAWLLKNDEKMTNLQIAKIMKVSESTVKRLTSAAKTKLKNHLKDFYFK